MTLIGSYHLRKLNRSYKLCPKQGHPGLDNTTKYANGAI
jgi:hypothetical protein